MPSGDVDVRLGRQQGVVHHAKGVLPIDEDIDRVALPWPARPGYPQVRSGSRFQGRTPAQPAESPLVMRPDDLLECIAGEVVEMVSHRRRPFSVTGGRPGRWSR